MKKYLLASLFGLAFLTVFAQETEIRYLSGTDKDHTVRWDFCCTKGMNSGNWTSIQVPSQWEQQGFGAYNYGQGDPFNDEKGLYKFHFAAPDRWKDNVVELVFEGSMTDTEVKVNGKSAGPIHQGGFYPFRYDISKLIQFGTDNLLEVTVSKESTDSSINRAERRGDYWDFGGIYRPVYLEILPQSHIHRVAIDARADGTFNMDVFLQEVHKPTNLSASIQTMDGHEIGTALTAKMGKNSSTVHLSGRFDNPKLWTPETPNLYQVVLTLKEAKSIRHRIRQTFGFRTVEVRLNDGIYVNGTKIMFKGVCRHTFWPESGRCSSKAQSISDVETIKAMNMNAVRMSHYPPDQHFLDVCDSLGLFVLDELAGWQAYYSTATGKRLVRQMVERDVNHPCIVLWDNGNEGGFNPELRNDYALYDPQKRTVIEPWSKINGTDTKHYPGYRYVEQVLTKGHLIFFPTEFLHGLYDGGHGAGLDDYWKLMLSSPLSAGGFLWVLADEGVVRKDRNDSIDNHGNNAPDGILGPHHEREGSFYAIRDIWSPVIVERNAVNGTLTLSNRYLYSDLSMVAFQLYLLKYYGTFPNTKTKWDTVRLNVPHVLPGQRAELVPDWPENVDSYDVLFLKAVDASGNSINNWSWNLSTPETLADNLTDTLGKSPVKSLENKESIQLTSGKTSVSFSKINGLLTQVVVDGCRIPFENGPVFTGDTLTFKSMRTYPSGTGKVVEVRFMESPDCFLKWTMKEGGLLQLDYHYRPIGKTDLAGISFDFPEKLVTGARLMANGPYRVWKNRLKGNLFGIYGLTYNNTITGQTWDYPEFKGYYSNFYAVEIQNQIRPFTIHSATPDLFLHLFTPDKPKYVKGGVYPPFPKGNISFMNGISAIGTKFSKPEEEGPQSQKNDYGPEGKGITGQLVFDFDY